MAIYVLLASALALVSVDLAKAELKICSFNVQVFGSKKARNQFVVDTLARIFAEYDLCLLQELRDTSNKSINDLVKTVGKQSNKSYGKVISERLGRTNSKEHIKKVRIVESYVFNDVRNVFEREPFIVQFKRKSGKMRNFFIAGIHTKPEAAKHEVGNLTHVYDDAVKKLGIEDGIIMGDFNAACTYFPKMYWKKNALRQDKRFVWLIGDSEKTSIGKRSCAYDRIVIRGAKLEKFAVKAKPRYYDKEFGLTSDKTKEISDHYPVEFALL